MYTAPQIMALKSKKKIVMLTAYDYLLANYLEKAGVDIILVGDSLGMVFLGYKDTLPVTVDDVIYHVKAVKRGAKDTMIVADMPFMSYQESIMDAVRNAGKIVKTSGASAVKLEGGLEACPQIKALVSIGIPVMGHIGLQPQSVNKYGGYPVQGVSGSDITRLIKEAKAIEEAGAFAIVAEKVLSKTAAVITKSVNIPVIGIGSGPGCDGQVLVTPDLLGAFEDFTPKFVKKYDNVSERSIKALGKFIKDVRNKRFPGRKYYY